MNKVFSFIALAFLGCGSAAAQQVNVSNVQRPKLVVGIVVDQMRWDYLYRYQKRYGEGGFKRLLNEGFSCENTRIPYVPSVTAIGHTCLYTGSVPSIHGIAGNNFVKNGKKVYCTDDETVKPVGSNSKASLDEYLSLYGYDSAAEYTQTLSQMKDVIMSWTLTEMFWAPALQRRRLFRISMK